MRFSIILPIVASALLFSFAASAQGTPFGNGTNSRGNSSADDEEDPDKPQPYYQRKPWSIGSSVETNRTILQEDVGGRIKAFNTLSLYAAFNITKKDQVRATGGFIQRFVADQTETGIRTDDIGLGYNHRFALPLDMMLVPSISNSFPTSFNSQLMGLIALPRAGLFVMRSFLDNNLTVSVRGGGSYYIVKYRQAEGQIDANPRAQTNVGLNFNYSMPFHQALQVGASVSTSWSWSYDVDHANDATLREQFKNTPVEPSADQYVSTPPAQQGYGGDIYISYNLPSLEGINTNLQVSLSQGDGTLREGATHLYWLSRRGGQASASLTVSY
jgi:hypothetical protein